MTTPDLSPLSFKLNTVTIGSLPRSKAGFATPKDLKALKIKLNEAKSKIDEYYDTDRDTYSVVSRERDPFSRAKYSIAKNINGKNVTNAWLKMYEMLALTDILPRSDGKKGGGRVYKGAKKEINAFLSAEMPGSFILALNHFLKAEKTDVKEYDWRANSFMSENSLEDKYGFLESKYAGKWLMKKDENDGDVTNADNLYYMHKRLRKENFLVDLYTSDLGSDASSDFNRQEEMHAKANLGQILLGLITLRRGGSMITKQFTFFEPFTLSLIAIVASFFEEVYIHKPLTSRSVNSEVYLVCKNFLWDREHSIQTVTDSNVSTDANVINAMFQRLKNFNDAPFLSKKVVEDTLPEITEAAKVIYERQIEEILKVISTYQDVVKLRPKYGTKEALRRVLLPIKQESRRFVEQWLVNVCPATISDHDNFDIKESILRNK